MPVSLRFQTKPLPLFPSLLLSTPSLVTSVSPLSTSPPINEEAVVVGRQSPPSLNMRLLLSASFATVTVVVAVVDAPVGCRSAAVVCRLRLLRVRASSNYNSDFVCLLLLVDVVVLLMLPLSVVPLLLFANCGPSSLPNSLSISCDVCVVCYL